MFDILKGSLTNAFNIKYFFNRMKGALGLAIGNYLLSGLFSYSGESAEKPRGGSVEVYFLFHGGLARKGKVKVYPIIIPSGVANDISYLRFLVKR